MSCPWSMKTFPGLIQAGAVVIGYAEDAYWLDVGTPEAFVRGSCDVVLGALPSAGLACSPGDFLVLSQASVAAEAVLSGGTTEGHAAVIEAGAVVSGSVIFDGAAIGPYATVRDSIVGKGAVIAGGAVLNAAWSSATAPTSGRATSSPRGCGCGRGARLEGNSVQFSSGRVV